MTTTAQQFDRAMWDAFSGCERWPQPGTTEPVSREVGDVWLVIADRQAVTATQQNNEVWVLDVAFPVQRAAVAFLNGLPEAFTPERYGFQLISGSDERANASLHAETIPNAAKFS